MASLSFPITGLQPITRDQPAPAPAEAGGPKAVDPNKQDAPQGDTVTITAAFPPPQPAQQSANVTIEQFSLFMTQTEAQSGQNAAPAAAPTTAPGAPTTPPASQANVQAAAVGTPATAIGVDPGILTTGTPASQTGATTDPQKELAQLDQTLQQLGIDPQDISLFNRMGLLLYANDPAALQNVVRALQAVDQQINQLGTAANSATQQQGPVKEVLPPAVQGQAQASQANAQVTPQALTPAEVSTLAQAVATPQTQSPAQTQNQTANSAGTTTFAAQLSFSDIQATLQQQSTPAQGSSANPSAPTNTAGTASAQTNSLLVNFQELQLSFQAVEAVSSQQQAAPADNSPAEGQRQTVNVNA